MPIMFVPAGQAAGAAASASLDVRVRVPRVLHLRVLRAEAPVLGARRDAAGQLAFEVVCNLRGYALRLAVHDPDVEAVEVEGLGEPLRFGAEGAVLYMPVRDAAQRRQSRTLSYRVRFAPGARPGPRALPFSVSLSGA
jgi:hypothetical protein